MPTLSDLAKLVEGDLTSQPNLEVSGAASISRALSTEITLVTSKKYYDAFNECNAVAAVSNVEFPDSVKPLIVVKDAEAAFARVVEQFQPPVKRNAIGISPEAIVSPTANIADDVSIYPGAVIMDGVQIGPRSVIYPNVTLMENCVVGADVQIFPNATLYENTVIGDRVIIHAGVVIGVYGFGYRSSSVKHTLSAQLGNVVIENDVEIGANSTIDRGTYDSTIIGEGTKLDDLVMVGHNCDIGKHNLFCSQVGIAGSCKTGDFVVMGGQVGLADHLTIESGASIAAKSGLMHDVAEGARMFGIPARPSREQLQIVAIQSKLPELKKTVSKLVQRVESLESDVEESSDIRAA